MEIAPTRRTPTVSSAAFRLMGAPFRASSVTHLSALLAFRATDAAPRVQAIDGPPSAASGADSAKIVLRFPKPLTENWN